jgi:hypothetical protein
MAERTTERPSAPPVRPASADAASRTAAPAAARTPRPGAPLAGWHAGFAVRRVPPPEGSPADAPWRIKPPAPSNDGNSHTRAAAPEGPAAPSRSQ